MPKQNARLYEVVEGINRFHLSGVDDPEFFRQFQKQSFNGEFVPELYSISGPLDRTYWWDTDIFVDGQYPLALRRDRHTIAVASLDLVNFTPEGQMTEPYAIGLEVKNHYPITVQLQGRSLCQHHLQPIKWGKMFLATIEKWAKESGFESCFGLPMNQNERIDVSPEMHLRYDVTFKRNGYKLWNNYWRKSLQTKTSLE